DAAGGTLRVVRGEHTAALRLEREPANLIVLVDGVVRGARRVGALEARGLGVGAPFDAPPAGGPPALAATVDALEAAGAGLVRAAIEAPRAERRRDLAKAAKRRRKQLRRRLRAIEGDLARVDRVEGLRRDASLLLADLSRIAPDAEEAQVTDWHADPPAPRTIRIDPKRTPREEAEHRFDRARKLERGGEIALERHALTERELARLDALIEDLPDASEGALDAIEEALARLGARPQPPPASRRDAGERVPHRAFRGAGGRAILVGRSAADNDALTLRHARPWDLWLHAREVPGSHVVVPLERDEDCPPDLLVDAAHLAAHYSEARGEPRVEVQYVARRHVRKPRGAAPGAVMVQREKVMLLRVEPDRLARLLES
ncbi:MAG TPA: NFACT RNA binding domain-containing protein, partial [Sandaracinaceae bacterium LLY-WYZ-13_1]|nr:NFACT RNA binding domain-containing protein [Sandaracinaceae bacterium LLY-WYZ-13_1]